MSIGRRAGCGVHVSHFNSLAELMLPLLDEGRRQRHRRDVRSVLLPRRQHDPRHGRAAALGAGRRHRRDARAARAIPAIRERLRTGSPTPAVRSRHVRLAIRSQPRISALRRARRSPRPPAAASASSRLRLRSAPGHGHGGGLRGPHFATADGRRHRRADAPPAHDGRQRRHLHRRQAPPARLRLLRPLPRPPRPRRRLDARRGRACTCPTTPPVASGSRTAA